MKKKHLLLLALATFTMSGASAQVTTAEFDILHPTTLTMKPKSIGELKETSGKFKQDGSKNNWIMLITGETIEKDGVEISVTKGTKSEPRLFWAGKDKNNVPDNPTEADYDCDLRYYAGAKITVKVPAGNRITEIELTGKNASNNCKDTPVTTGGGEQIIEGTTNLWMADDITDVNEVLYTIPGDAGTQMIVNVKVSFEATAAINDVIVDDNARIFEYYNLSGVKCDARGLTPGVYLRRAGSTVTKVFVK